MVALDVTVIAVGNRIPELHRTLATDGSTVKGNGAYVLNRRKRKGPSVERDVGVVIQVVIAHGIFIRDTQHAAQR